jgi:hypothetical protein
MPVVRNYHGVKLIKEIEINNLTSWRNKILKTIENNYISTPFFKEVFPKIYKLLLNPSNSLSAYNISAIKTITKMLGFDTSKFVLGSTLGIEGKATDLLIAITKSVGGTAYLCGGGASNYQEDEKFTDSRIELLYQNFAHPVYPQNRLS